MHISLAAVVNLLMHLPLLFLSSRTLRQPVHLFVHVSVDAFVNLLVPFSCPDFGFLLTLLQKTVTIFLHVLVGSFLPAPVPLLVHLSVLFLFSLRLALGFPPTPLLVQQNAILAGRAPPIISRVRIRRRTKVNQFQRPQINLRHRQ